MSTSGHASRGLFFIFLGTVFTAVGSVLPKFGWLLSAVGGLVELYGVWLASKANPNFKSALYAIFLRIVVLIIAGLLAKLTFIKLALDILSAFLSVSIVYFICMATAELLSGVSTKLIIWANRVWMFFLGFNVASIAGLVTALFAPALSAFFSGLAAIVSAVTLVVSMIFYYRAHLALK